MSKITLLAILSFTLLSQDAFAQAMEVTSCPPNHSIATLSYDNAEWKAEFFSFREARIFAYLKTPALVCIYGNGQDIPALTVEIPPKYRKSTCNFNNIPEQRVCQSTDPSNCILYCKRQ